VHGLPFGEDILVLIWVSTLAVLNMTHGKVPRIIAQSLRPSARWPHIQAHAAAFPAVFYATFFYGQKKEQGRTTAYSVRFFDHLDLWFTRDLEATRCPVTTSKTIG
jgi:hypothetical protein